MCPGEVKSMLGPGGVVRAECLLEKMQRWDPEGEGVGSASLSQARTPQTRCLMGVSFSPGGEKAPSTGWASGRCRCTNS